MKNEDNEEILSVLIDLTEKTNLLLREEGRKQTTELATLGKRLNDTLSASLAQSTDKALAKQKAEVEKLKIELVDIKTSAHNAIKRLNSVQNENWWERIGTMVLIAVMASFLTAAIMMALIPAEVDTNDIAQKVLQGLPSKKK